MKIRFLAVIAVLTLTIHAFGAALAQDTVGTLPIVSNGVTQNATGGIPCRTFVSTTPGLEIHAKAPYGDTLFVDPTQFGNTLGVTVTPLTHTFNGPGGQQHDYTWRYSPNDHTLDGFLKRYHDQLAELKRRYSSPNYQWTSG